MKYTLSSGIYEFVVALCVHEVLGADALRMRLRRLCETKGTGKCHVCPQTQAEYKAGGEKRQWLELALLESLKRWGTKRDMYQKVKAGTGALRKENQIVRFQKKTYSDLK